MKKIKFVKRQDSGFKLSYGNSGETSLNLSNEIFDFISQGTISPGEERNVTFRIYKEDFIKAMSFVIMKLPLYKTSSNYSNKVDNYLDIFGELYSRIESFFGSNKEAKYNVSLLYRPDGRIYLKGLRVNGFSIRDYLVENFSALQFDNEGDDMLNLRVLSDIEDNGEYENEESQELEVVISKPFQQIFYGAPGTGKSFKIKVDTENAEEAGRVIRTTFHPDSDYSTFVGAYKPSMDKEKKHVRMNMSLEDLAKELSGYYNDNKLGKIGGVQKFCLDYHEFIDGEIMSVNVNKLLELAGIPEAYNVEVNKYVKFCQLLPKQDRGKIIYAFTPQAFTNAYVKAWNTEEDVFLIIEEINRGNCAQIFGDLFQLLDRKNGVSEYPVDADTDLADYLSNALAQSPRTDFPDGVKEGKKLVLPSNLYVWATMNTSDQSLFPIDSAFKRRWDWVYIPIKDHEDKNYKIDIAGSTYNWWGFLEKINSVIGETTSSEDKKLGYFFVKTDDGIIKEDKFVSKVLFYLWNDVFKNYGFDNAIFSRGENKKFSFSDFFQKDGSFDTIVVNEFLKKLDETIDKEHSYVIRNNDNSPSIDNNGGDDNSGQTDSE